MGQAISCASGGRSFLTSAGNGDTATVREVLAARPELAGYTYFANGQNVAHIAAAKGDREVLQTVVETLQIAARLPVEDGIRGEMALKEQALHAINMGRQLKEVLNTRTHSGQTPLMLACQAGHVSCVKYLLDSGADVFIGDKAQRRSAIHYAAAAGQIGVLRALLSDSQVLYTEEGLQPLRNVRVHDMSGQCRYIDSRAENGVTALHLAAIHGEVACVHALLGSGASMMVRTVDLDMMSSISIPAGSTPLHLAAQKGQVAIVQAMLQAHADALGNWAREDGQDRGGRRGWEQDGRIDLRSVANSLRQLPYHVAWQRGFRDTAQVLNPTIPIDVALENVRELDEGSGTQKLATLAAYALRRNLLAWLESYQERFIAAEKEREQRQLRQKVIADQRRKEALKLHSELSAEASLAALDARLVSPQDAGHTFAVPAQHTRAASQTSTKELGLIEENSDELLNTMEWAKKLDEQAEKAAKQKAAVPEPCQEEAAESSGQPGPSLPLQDSNKSDKPPSKAAWSAKRSSSIRKSSRRLLPTRPPPPPPINRMPSASERALALAGSASKQIQGKGKGHGRKLSWETFGRHSQESQSDSVDRGTNNSPDSTQQTWLCSPFASPFAEASRTPLTGEDLQGSGDSAEELGSRIPISTHPSGVDLMDPPEGTPVLVDATLPSMTSRRGSKPLLSFRSKKSLQLRQEPSGRYDFVSAASIPGFDNNLDEDEDCGICLDEMVNVCVNGCSHKLCAACALKLCQVNKKPPLCPFCRTFIEGFHAVVGSPVKM